MKLQSIKKWLAFFFLGCALVPPVSGAMISVKIDQDADKHDKCGTLNFAAGELKHFGESVPRSQKLAFLLAVDEALPPFAFSIQRHGDTINLSGKTPAETLCAAYTVLEQMGYRFEVTGPVTPAALDGTAVSENRQVITPAIQRRGIRQHVNFNMDVSSYPIVEAKDYIRNLARLRYNYMTFHSYPCHWTRDRYGNRSAFDDFADWMKAYNPKPEDLVTGAYYYGGEFKIPNHPLIKPHIRFNKQYFCAPEFEDVIHTQPDRGQKAQTWLRELMFEAKRCGMTVHFSTELKMIDNRYNQELAERILADYPMIDLLEFNSQEAGDFTMPDAVGANQAMAEDIINGTDESKLNASYRRYPEAPLCPQIRNYANCIRIIKYLQAQDWEKKHNVKLVCGSYAIRPTNTKVELELAEKYLLPDQILAIMPGHSSLEVNAQIQLLAIKPQILNRLMIHSWLEFDGFMMLQQQTTKGIYDLMQYVTQATGKPPYGIVCNHWRTAPNTLSFQYLDEVSFNGKLAPETFFKQTAARLGIPAAESIEFAKAMATIDKLSDKRIMPTNVGFAIFWQIKQATRDIGWLSIWNRKQMEAGRDGFAEARRQLQVCRDKCREPHGQALLDQLINDTSCSVEHLEGVLELKTITEKYVDAGPGNGRVRDNLTPDDEAFIAVCAAKADVHFQKYLTLLAGHITDRGEEGMLITYYWEPVVYCHNIRAIYGKQGEFISRNADDSVVPLPY